MSERHVFPLSGMAPCSKCGGGARVELDLHDGGTGYTVGTGYEHEAKCPAVVCPHGRPWREVCDPCEAVVSAKEIALGKRTSTNEGDSECGQ